MSRITRRSYTDEFKHQAVELAESLGPAAAARQLEMSVKTLAKKKRRRSLPESPSEVRLRRQSKDSLPDQVVVSGSWGFCLWIP
ncbi:hypothetical protein [Stenotrophomonas maltophilia]|uniref:hypothetical protein n=1 Tax=Stenotrophomonas maltophilia TaxID=40324 RepID=UPI000A758AFB|nr:hypothetical protein [Stenotrophomonas maltophilia]